MKKKGKAWTRKIAVCLFWLALWQVLALAAGSGLLVAGPWETAAAWFKSIREPEFVGIILYSCARIGAGFLAAAAVGAALGFLAYRFPALGELLAPPLLLCKSVPVASFAVLLLIWWGSGGLSAAVVFLVALPGACVAVAEGLAAADRKMLEMAQVFALPRRNRFFYIYRPALRPFVESFLRVSVGMGWKAGVAAEVIGTPAFSIGERLYLSKIYLDTAGVFAWTATVILISWLSERLGLYLWERFCAWKPACKPPTASDNREPTASDNREPTASGSREAMVSLNGISKSFAGKQVLSDIVKDIEPGGIYCLTAPSGAGKTTLLRILAGLERPDGASGLGDGSGGSEKRGLGDGSGGKDRRASGRIAPRPSMVFQEDRLAEEESAVRNVLLACGEEREAEVRSQLALLLSPEDMEKPCGLLSGGMKRRVCLVRAVAAESELLLLDEPFTGLDEESRRDAIGYLLAQRRNRTVILATHREEDCALLGGEIWKL